VHQIRRKTITAVTIGSGFMVALGSTFGESAKQRKQAKTHQVVYEEERTER
jgi:hypothetical protein